MSFEGLETTMARSKSTKAKAKAERSMKQIGVRSTREWAEWVERAAAFCRTDVAKLIDTALIKYLKAEGFEEPSPPRV
jgi:hypothetical protein